MNWDSVSRSARFSGPHLIFNPKKSACVLSILYSSSSKLRLPCWSIGGCADAQFYPIIGGKFCDQRCSMKAFGWSLATGVLAQPCRQVPSILAHQSMEIRAECWSSSLYPVAKSRGNYTLHCSRQQYQAVCWSRA